MKEQSMTFRLSAYLGLFLLLTASTSMVSNGQEKMTKEEWQQQITSYTAQRDSLKQLLASLTSDVDSLKGVLASLDQKIAATHDETLKMLGATDADLKAFEDKLSKLESWADELSKLSNQDLFARKSEVDSLQSAVTDMMKSKLAAIESNHARLLALQQKIDALKATLAQFSSKQEKVYVVGTWARNRDCLWNISKKKDIYGNPFMWPKIWEGNRDQIRDPDIIHPGQRLKIPEAGPLTNADKRAERRYWAHKRAAMSKANAGGTK
jgi:small-conductance mechanosensitive channel